MKNLSKQYMTDEQAKAFKDEISKVLNKLGNDVPFALVVQKDYRLENDNCFMSTLVMERHDVNSPAVCEDDRITAISIITHFDIHPEPGKVLMMLIKKIQKGTTYESEKA